jgi:tetratricopeptide (TPR) repeat protein
MPEVAFALGRTYEREQNWPAAVNNYEAWLQAYPAHALRSKVEYARAWAVSQTGDEARAFELFTNYVSQYTNNLTPLAYWWVADHYFRSGTNFLKAEEKFQLIFENFPTNELACRAQLMAARSAMGVFNYNEAIRFYLNPLVGNTNCPADVAMQARFAYCEALLRSPDTNNVYLQTASNLLSQICAMYPTNEPGALAWSEAGDCYQQMGSLDAATNAYAQVLNSRAASQELCSRALVGWALVLEKKAEGMPDDARNALLDLAMKQYEAAFDPDTDVNADADVKSEWWIKEAGLKILALNAKTGSIKGRDLDKLINKMEVYFPELKDSLEQKRQVLKD